MPAWPSMAGSRKLLTRTTAACSRPTSGAWPTAAWRHWVQREAVNQRRTAGNALAIHSRHDAHGKSMSAIGLKQASASMDWGCLSDIGDGSFRPANLPAFFSETARCIVLSEVSAPPFSVSSRRIASAAGCDRSVPVRRWHACRREHNRRLRAYLAVARAESRAIGRGRAR